MGKVRASGVYLGLYDEQHDCDLGILGVQKLRIVADIYKSKTEGYSCVISHVIFKCGVFRLDVLYRLGKYEVEQLEYDVLQTYINEYEEKNKNEISYQD